MHTLDMLCCAVQGWTFVQPLKEKTKKVKVGCGIDANCPSKENMHMKPICPIV